MFAFVAVAIGGMLAPATGFGAAAERAVFRVADVAVDVTAADAGQARAQARIIGRRQALERLFKRLVPATDQHRLPMPGDAAIKEFIQGFEVTDERVGPNRYIAALTFHFKPNEIGQLLRDHGVPYAVTPSRPVVVVPLYRVEGELLLWEDGNPWRAAWANLEPGDGLLRVIVPIGELADLALVDVREAVEGDSEGFAALAERYEAGEVVVADAVVEGAPLLSAPMIGVTLRRYQDQSVRVSGGTYSGMDWVALDSVLSIAARTTRMQIEEEWKEANLLRFEREDSIAVDIPLGGLTEWLDIHGRLVGLALVRKVDIAALSPRFARIVLHYVGDVQQLARALANDGLDLSREADLWILRPHADVAGTDVAGEAATNSRGLASE